MQLKEHGATADDIKKTITVLEAERKRRTEYDADSTKRTKQIQSNYKPLNKIVFKLEVSACV